MVLLRHMKIAAKIGTGFGIVCVLMAVITIAVYLSGNGTTKSVDEVDAMVIFDAAVNDTKSTYYEARIYANIFLNNNSEKAYKDFTDYSAKALESINGLADLASSDSLFKDAVSGINNFNTLFNTWDNNLEDVQKNYTAMKALDESLDGVMQQAKSTLDDVLSDSSLSEKELLDMSKIAISTQVMHVEAEHILAGGEAEYYEEVISMADEIITELSNGGYENIVEDINSFKEMLTEYVDLLNSNTSKIADSHKYGEQALSSLDDVLNTADKFMQETIESTKNTSQGATLTVVIISSASILFSIFLATYLARKISAPLKRVRDRLQKIADTGNIHVGDEQLNQIRFDASFKDEVGQCNYALFSLLETLGSLDRNLYEIANGNLSVDVKLLSQEDTMGLAMQMMIQSLNKTFNEVNGISKEIAENAKDVSESSLNLAQGATEQTAAVAALGQSISKVAEKTLESARMAIDAAKLGDTIKHNAEIGTQQMDQMLDAVGQITDASASISKVIKVIDDIAFQTNILALNAAVEAARAGQHGKGFAVVAEEVRDLAAKSAEAAKDTGSLIENSIQKANLGAKIATATSASLADIVAGINESSRIVNIIAQSSENQTNAINEINRGIGQVGEVVHLISKGAELSSGASNSMREESDALHNFVSSYNLKEVSDTRLFLGK